MFSGNPVDWVVGHKPTSVWRNLHLEAGFSRSGWSVSVVVCTDGSLPGDLGETATHVEMFENLWKTLERGYVLIHGRRDSRSSLRGDFEIYMVI